jgi:hypothetical protein
LAVGVFRRYMDHKLKINLGRVYELRKEEETLPIAEETEEVSEKK